MTATNGYNPTFQLYNSDKGYSEKGSISPDQSRELNGLFRDLKFSPVVQKAIGDAAKQKGIRIKPIEQGRIEVYASWNGQVQLRYTDSSGSVNLSQDDLQSLTLENPSSGTALHVAQKILNINSPQKKDRPVHSRNHSGLGSTPSSGPHTEIHNHNGDQATIADLLERIRSLEDERRDNEAYLRNANAALIDKIGSAPSMQSIPPEFFESFLKQQQEIYSLLEAIKLLILNLGNAGPRAVLSGNAPQGNIEEIRQRLNELSETLRKQEDELGELKSQRIPVLEQRIKELEGALAIANEDLKTAKQTILTLTDENAHLTSQLRTANQSIERLDQINGQQATEIAELRSALTANQTQLNEQQELIASLRQQILSLESKLAAANSELEIAKGQNESDQETIGLLQKELEELKALLKTTQDQNGSLDELTKKQTDELANNREALTTSAATIDINSKEIKALKDRISELEDKLRLADARLPPLQSEIDSLKQQLAQQNGRLATLEKENSRLAAENARLKSNAASSANLRAQNEALQKRIAELEKAVEKMGALQGQLGSANQHLAAFREAVTKALELDKTASIQQIETKISEMHAEIRQLRADQNSKGSLAAQLAELTQKLSSQEQDLQKLLQDKKTFDTVTAAINGENKELLARIAELERVISKNNAQIKSLETELEELKRKAGQDQNEANEKIRNLEQELEALKIKSLSDQSLIAQLKEENEGLLSNSRKLSETIEEQQAEIEQLRLQIQALNANLHDASDKEAEIQKLQDEVNRLKGELAVRSMQHPVVAPLTQRPTPEIIDLEFQIDQLKTQLDERTLSHDQLIAKMNSLESANLDLQTLLEEQDQEIADLKKQKRPAPPSTEELDKLRAQNGQLNQALSQNNTELEESSKRYWKVKAELDEVRNEAQVALDAAKAKNDELQDQQKTIKDHNVRLTSQNERLNEAAKDHAETQRKLEASLNAAIIQLEDFDFDKRKAQKETAESQAGLKKMREKENEREIELEETLKSKDDELAGLKQSLAAKDHELSAALKENAAAVVIYHRNQEEINLMELEIARLANQLKTIVTQKTRPKRSRSR